MKKNSLISLAAVALATLLAVPFIYAQQGPGPRGPHPMGMRGPGGPGAPGSLGLFGRLPRLQAELGLTDAQVAQIKTIFTSLRDQNEPYREQLKGSMHSVTAALLKDPDNVAAAQAILDQQAQAEHAVRTNLVNATAKALNVLTAEQRTKLADLIAQRQARRAGRRGM